MRDRNEDRARLDALAERIAGCIGSADAEGLHVVAAHLELALQVLRPTPPAEERSRPERPTSLH